MNSFLYMMITSSPDIASYIEECGVARIFMDREILGKKERQGHLDTHVACHSYEEIHAVAKVLRSAELMVRVNPLNSSSHSEVEKSIDAGAGRLMLPMFSSTHDVEKFSRIVNGRVPITFLAETPQALLRLSDWISVLNPDEDEVHIGLNDLSIAIGSAFLFEPLIGGMLEYPAQIMNAHRIKWGFGGISRLSNDDQLARPSLVMSEHMRLGSTRVILSRAFHGSAAGVDALKDAIEFPYEIRLLRDAEQFYKGSDLRLFEQNRQELMLSVNRYVRKITL